MRRFQWSALALAMAGIAILSGTGRASALSWTATTNGEQAVSGGILDGTGLHVGTTTILACTPPSATITAPASICAGNSYSGTASVPDAGTGATYLWTVTNGSILGGNNGRVVNFTAGASGSVGLAVTVTQAGCSSSGQASVPINPTPSAAVTAVPNPICGNSTGNIASVPDAGTGASYLWTITNGTITSATNIRTITYTANTYGSVWLTVSVIGSDGCGVEGTLRVFIDPSAFVLAPAYICQGNSYSGTATVDEEPGYTYLWTVTNASILGGNSGATVTFTTGGTGSVGLAVTVTKAGCSSSGQATVPIHPTPSAAVTAVPNPVCGNSTGNIASVPDAGTGASYLWSITNGTITSATNIRTITYTAGASGSVTLNVRVNVQNSNWCVGYGSAIVTIANPSAVITAASSVCANSQGNTASVPAATGGTYAWTITNGTITSATNLQTVTYTAGASGSVTLNVTVVSNGCGATGSATVTINANPSAVITVASAVCANSQGNTASVPAATSGTYTWTITNGTITSATNLRVITYTAGASGSVTLNVTVVGSNGCGATGSKIVTINANPAAPTIIAPESMCDDTGPTNASVWQPLTGATYQWTLTDAVPVGSLSNSSCQFTSGALPGPVGLTVTVTQGGCSASASVSVPLYPRPFSTQITAQPNPVYPGSTSNSASVPNVAGQLYFWGITNGTFTSATTLPSITYTAGASGTVTLYVSVSGAYTGCELQGQLDVPVIPPPTVTVVAPQVGSPAGGTQVAISGTNFSSGATVNFGTVPATNVTFLSSTDLTATAPAGTGVVDIQVTNPGNQVGTLTNGYTYGAVQYYLLTPCRLVDTRNANGTFGGPAFSNGVVRTFPITGNCGVPSTAKVVLVNATATQVGANGYFTLWPAGISQVPITSTVGYSAGSAVANNAAVDLGLGGQISVYCGQPSGGTTGFVLDIYGYLQ